MSNLITEYVKSLSSDRSVYGDYARTLFGEFDTLTFSNYANFYNKYLSCSKTTDNYDVTSNNNNDSKSLQVLDSLINFISVFVSYSILLDLEMYNRFWKLYGMIISELQLLKPTVEIETNCIMLLLHFIRSFHICHDSIDHLDILATNLRSVLPYYLKLFDKHETFYHIEIIYFFCSKFVSITNYHNKINANLTVCLDIIRNQSCVLKAFPIVIQTIESLPELPKPVLIRPDCSFTNFNSNLWLPNYFCYSVAHILSLPNKDTNNNERIDLWTCQKTSHKSAIMTSFGLVVDFFVQKYYTADYNAVEFQYYLETVCCEFINNSDFNLWFKSIPSSLSYVDFYSLTNSQRASILYNNFILLGGRLLQNIKLVEDNSLFYNFTSYIFMDSLKAVKPICDPEYSDSKMFSYLISETFTQRSVQIINRLLYLLRQPFNHSVYFVCLLFGIFQIRHNVFAFDDQINSKALAKITALALSENLFVSLLDDSNDGTTHIAELIVFALTTLIKTYYQIPLFTSNSNTYLEGAISSIEHDQQTLVKSFHHLFPFVQITILENLFSQIASKLPDYFKAEEITISESRTETTALTPYQALETFKNYKIPMIQARTTQPEFFKSTKWFKIAIDTLEGCNNYQSLAFNVLKLTQRYLWDITESYVYNQTHISKIWCNLLAWMLQHNKPRFSYYLVNDSTNSFALLLKYLLTLKFTPDLSIYHDSSNTSHAYDLITLLDVVQLRFNYTSFFTDDELINVINQYASHQAYAHRFCLDKECSYSALKLSTSYICLDGLSDNDQILVSNLLKEAAEKLQMNCKEHILNRNCS